DRHHENWGVLYDPEPRLAPSYDHASSLGRELNDRNKATRLDGRDSRQTVETYIKRARSAFFEHTTSEKPVHPLKAFELAWRVRPLAGRVFLARLNSVSEDALSETVERIPAEMTTPTSQRFCIEVLRKNRLHLENLVEPKP
ncbi:MAG: hypothetical protein AAGA56_20940, partial [Myxococcota bacterium]